MVNFQLQGSESDIRDQIQTQLKNKKNHKDLV